MPLRWPEFIFDTARRLLFPFRLISSFIDGSSFKASRCFGGPSSVWLGHGGEADLWLVFIEGTSNRFFIRPGTARGRRWGSWRRSPVGFAEEVLSCGSAAEASGSLVVCGGGGVAWYSKGGWLWRRWLYHGGGGYGVFRCWPWGSLWLDLAASGKDDSVELPPNYNLTLLESVLRYGEIGKAVFL